MNKNIFVIVIALSSVISAHPRNTKIAPEFHHHHRTREALPVPVEHLITAEDINNSLRLVVKAGLLSYVQQLVEELGADVTGTDINGDTLLHYAASFGYIDIVKYLIAMGIDVNTKGMYGDTSLHCAIMNGHIDIVHYLINECNADINIQNKLGLDALGIAQEMQRMYQAIEHCIMQAEEVKHISQKPERKNIPEQAVDDIDAMFDKLMDEMVESGAVSEEVNVQPLPQWKLVAMQVGDFVLTQYDACQRLLATCWAYIAGERKKQFSDKKTAKNCPYVHG